MTTWVFITYYNSQQLHVDDDYFDHPHKDSELFTVLLLQSSDGAEGLGIAALTRPGVKQSANMRLFGQSLLCLQVIQCSAPSDLMGPGLCAQSS